MRRHDYTVDVLGGATGANYSTNYRDYRGIKMPTTRRVYAHGTQGFLMCLDGDTGKVVWQHSLTEEFGRVTGYGGRSVSPTVDGDLVIVGMINSSWGDQKGGNRWLAVDKMTAHCGAELVNEVSETVSLLAGVVRSSTNTLAEVLKGMVFP